MMKKMIFSMLFLMMAVGLSSSDLTWKVSGIVYDSSNLEPICGATVTVLGLGVGTVTDEDGKYALTFKFNPSSVSLKFESIGFVTVTRSISNDQIINVGLNPALL